MVTTGAKSTGTGRSAAAPKKPKDGSFSEHVYSSLKSSILTLDAAGGSILFANSIARDFGCSRGPVRESLVRLNEEKLLELLPKYGARIPQVTLAHVREVAECRRVVEEYSISHLGAVSNKEERVKALDQLAMEQIERSTDGAHDKELMHLDCEFHKSLVSLVPNQTLAKMYASLSDQQFRTGMALFRADPNRRVTAGHDHQGLVQALRNEDVDSALHLIDQHLIYDLEGLPSILA